MQATVQASTKQEHHLQAPEWESGIKAETHVYRCNANLLTKEKYNTETTGVCHYEARRCVSLQVHIEKNVLFGTAAKETMRAKFKGIDDRKLAEQVCHLQMTLHNFIQKKCF